MAITINWDTKVISVPQADLTSLGGSLYELDLDDFRLALRALEANEDGIVFDITHDHNTSNTLGSLTLARVITIINGYTVTFEDLQYGVNLVGANSNVLTNVNRNQVSVASSNSAGLIEVATGSAATDWSEAEKNQIRHRLGVDGTTASPS